MTEMRRARMNPSLTRRLALSVALVFAAGGTAVTVASLAYGRQAARQAYDRLLLGAANDIAGAILVRDGSIFVDIPASAFELLGLAPEDRILYAVYAPDGRLVTGYAVENRPRGTGFAETRFAGETARLVSVARRFSERDFNGTVDVVVGQTTRARSALAREIAKSALVVTGLLGLLMVGLAAFAVRSALTPLRRIEGVLAAREPRDLTPLDVAVPREIEQLVSAINRFMARQARQFEIMRNLIADASHQLRTPVAAIRAQAELASEEPDGARQQAIVGRIHARAVGLGRLADQLLNHALIIHRADAVPHEALDLRTVAIRILDEGLPDEDVRLDLSEEPVTCRADALSLVEAGKNLLGNALRYGVRPVTLAVRSEAGRPVIAVQDRGPGIPAALRARLAAGGGRFERSTAVTSQSAGLGLAIVSAVVAAHNGQLRLTELRAGGFEAAILLPPFGEEAR